MGLQLVRYVLLGALRDKLLLSMVLIYILVTSGSLFFGSSAILEQIQFALVFTSGSLRVAGVLGLVLFIVFFMRRSFESKDVEFLLSRPVTRLQFILSYSGAFSMIALLLGAASGLILYAISPSFTAGHALWVLSICVENIIMANIALFFAMVLTSASAGVLATLGFYVLARMMGQLLGIILATQNNDFIGRTMEYIFQIVSMIIPRLDLMGQTSWLIYPPSSEITAGFILLQGFVFTGLVLSACLFDLKKRQF